jgi:hypothetical protein
MIRALLILDAATEIPALAFRMDEPTSDAIRDPHPGLTTAAGGMLTAGVLARGGFGRTDADHHRYVCLIRANGDQSFRAEVDPYKWDDLTMTCAHRWLLDHLEEHPPGGALDVEPLRLEMVRGRQQVESAWSAGAHDHDDPGSVA